MSSSASLADALIACGASSAMVPDNLASVPLTAPKADRVATSAVARVDPSQDGSAVDQPGTGRTARPADHAAAPRSVPNRPRRGRRHRRSHDVRAPVIAAAAGADGVRPACPHPAAVRVSSAPDAVTPASTPTAHLDVSSDSRPPASRDRRRPPRVATSVSQHPGRPAARRRSGRSSTSRTGRTRTRWPTSSLCSAPAAGSARRHWRKRSPAPLRPGDGARSWSTPTRAKATRRCCCGSTRPSKSRRPTTPRSPVGPTTRSPAPTCSTSCGAPGATGSTSRWSRPRRSRSPAPPPSPRRGCTAASSTTQSGSPTWSSSTPIRSPRETRRTW